MQVIGLDGDDALVAEAGRVLARALRESGRTALVESTPPDTHESLPHGISTHVALSDDGRWTVTGMALELPGVLARLAPRHEYAIVTGHPRAKLPTIVVGATEATDDPLVTVETPADLDVGTVEAALKEVEPFETLESLVSRVKETPSADKAGAIATFTGRVRERDDEDDAPTTHLEFEKYGAVADERMAAIRTELEDRDGVYAVALHHRTGVVEAGEDIVFVVVLAGHREEAFATVSDGINRLKAEVPLFKKEVTIEEEYWVHERQT